MLGAVKTPSTWESLGLVPPDGLIEARLQLHWAAQVVAAARHSLAEKAPDDSHGSLGWEEATLSLAGRPVGDSGVRCALRPADLSVLVLTADGKVATEHALAGGTLDDALAWLRRSLSDRGVSSEALRRPEHDLPQHPVGEGAPFAMVAPEAFVELARWFANGDRILQAAVAGVESASKVRCWPHHFDIATLVRLDLEADAESAQSLGLGLSPGDGTYAQPYWYLLPWPPPGGADLPALDGGGRWFTEGWLGATLPASALVDTPAAEQPDQVMAFFRSASAASLSLLSR